MSADNWTTCPRCLLRAEKALDAERVRVDEAYGVVPLAEYNTMCADLKARIKAYASPYKNFREDYEFSGAEDGVVTASYRGSCTVCGLTLEFTDTHEIPGVDE